MTLTRTRSAVTVDRITKSYGDVDVLRGVSFAVDEGQIFALLGQNGAGKTTLVRILATLLAADGGSATVCGHDVRRAPAAVRAAISLTGQFAAVDEVLTGRENLVLIARLRHIPDPRSAAADLLERFGLTEAADRPTHTYSGGMRRRLDIAMSLLGTPRLIVLDEPTTGLDPEARREVWQVIRGLADGGTTVLLTTQYLDEAEHLADRIAILDEGRIIANDALAALRERLPAAQEVLVRKEPSLEDVFLTLIGSRHAAETSESDTTPGGSA